MFNVIIFGPPGSGKGTQSERIIEKYTLKHLSTGELLRVEKNSGSALGNQVASMIDHGELVPDELVQKMVEATVVKGKDSSGFIFDGFPRTTNQAKWLEDILHGIGSDTHVLLSLEVDEEELINRLTLRGIAAGRNDDKSRAVVENRLAVYQNQTMPVIEFYKKLGKYHRIDGMGSLDEVFGRICEVIDEKSLQ